MLGNSTMRRREFYTTADFLGTTITVRQRRGGQLCLCLDPFSVPQERSSEFPVALYLSSPRHLPSEPVGHQGCVGFVCPFDIQRASDPAALCATHRVLRAPSPDPHATHAALWVFRHVSRMSSIMSSSNNASLSSARTRAATRREC